MKGHNTIGNENLRFQYKSRNLPHWFASDKPIFITYRLNFTLPKAIINELNSRKTEWNNGLKALSGDELQMKSNEQDLTFFNWFDELLAQSNDVPQILHRKDLTDIIHESLRHFDKLRYELLAYCIMPNHVHVLVNPVKQPDGNIYPLAHITYTWKKYTATLINRLLGRRGALWQQESYDHMVRDENELRSVMQYIIDNPVKAGMVDKWEDWYGTWIHEDYRPR